MLVAKIIASATQVYINNNVEFVVKAKFLGNQMNVKTDMVVNTSRTARKTFFIITVMSIQNPQIKGPLFIFICFIYIYLFG